MFHTMHSKNVKVGDAAATYVPTAQTCPATCPLKDGNGCYAESGNVGMHNRRLTNDYASLNGDTIAILEGAEIRDASTQAPQGHPMRIHVSGDATTAFRASQLADGAAHWPGPVWSYTHAHATVPRSAWGRVSVLASCESLAQAKDALDRGYAPAIVVSKHPANGKAYRDPATGTKVIPCPAQPREGTTCTTCKLCWNDSMLLAQRAAIAFEVHGAQKKRALTVVK